MSKRFTDTEKFNDPWFRKLDLLHKIIWEYLLAECNHAGILEKFDIELMSFKIGAPISINDIKDFGDRVIFLSDETLFIPKFIKFQYGKLNSQSKIHASVIKELAKYNLQERFKEFLNPIDILPKELQKSSKTLKNKVKDKNKEKNNSSSLVLSSSYKKNDIICNQDFEKCFKIYSENCSNLLPLSYERRSRNILELLNAFLQEIDYNLEYFKGLCIKANDLKTIVDRKIDFKSLINNHIGIMNGKYESSAEMSNEAFKRCLDNIKIGEIT